jgi:predicted RND superfamily exporter protein
MGILETVKTLGFTVLVVIGIYLAVFLSYMLIPACVFLFVFYVIHTWKNSEGT